MEEIPQRFPPFYLLCYNVINRNPTRRESFEKETDINNTTYPHAFRNRLRNTT